MRPERFARVVALAAAGAAAVLGREPARAVAASPLRPPTPDSPVALRARTALPLSFEENRGQTDARARFLVRARGMTAFLCPGETVLALHSSAPREEDAGGEPELRTDVVRMRLVGAAGSSTIEACDPLPGRCSYFMGNDPTRWITDVPVSASVALREVWPGVDVVWRGDARGRLTYDLALAPGADLANVAFDFEGSRATAVGSDGSLRIATAVGELRHTRPVAFQVVDGARAAVHAAFDVTGDGRVGLTVGAHDPSRPLVIDPSLTYSTYLGGSATSTSEIGYSIAVDSSGAAYVAGSTPSLDFPTQGAFQSSLPATISGFVTKLNPSGSAFLWSTYLGGTSSSPSRPRGIAVDASGAAYVIGETAASDFPTQSPLQASHGGGTWDAFVTKLAPSGSSLAWSTNLGGSGSDWGWAIAADGNGAAYVTGKSSSSDFPLQSALQTVYGGVEDVFVAKIHANGSSLVYSTYLGGSNGEAGYGIAVDSSGSAYVAGQTHSTDFPTQSPLQGTHAGGTQDAFVAKLNASGSGLAWSTYLGGSASDHARGLAIDASDNAYVVGYTDSNAPGYSQSADFPTAGALQGTRGSRTDAFAAKIGSTGASLSYSTFLGGSTGNDVATGVAVDSAGAAIVVGYTWSTDFPTASPAQPSYAGGSWDVFVAKLGTSGSALEFSTYLGGAGADQAYGVAVDSTGDAYVTGNTTSADLPLRSPLQATYAGNGDAFVAKYPLGTGGPPAGPVPDAPTNLVATYTPGSGISLSWTDSSSDETGFRVERRPQGYSFAHLATTPANATSLVDGLLFPGATYAYRVRAFNAEGSSAWSNEAGATVPGGGSIPPVPRAPSELLAEDVGDGTIALSWKDNSPDEVLFGIERSMGGAAFEALAATPTDVSWYPDTELRPGWPSTYRVRALSLQGPSAYSNVAAANLPATLEIATLSGSMTDAPRPRQDKLKVLVSWTDASQGAAPLDPLAEGLELRLGPPVGGFSVSVPTHGFTVSKKKNGVPVKATWKSAPGATPKAKVVLDLSRRLVKAAISGADYSSEPTAAVRVLLASGADGGAQTTTWTERRAGSWRFATSKKTPAHRR